MNLRETAVDYSSSGSQLIGVIHRTAESSKRGVVMLCGKHRGGPHRWYVTQAREFAKAGIPVLRFSARGEAENEGNCIDSEDYLLDLRMAIDEFFRREASLNEIVLWGLCALASNALFHASTDSRVSAVILVNLYVETHYAAVAILQSLRKRIKTAVFWRRLIVGDFNPLITMRTLRSALNLGKLDPTARTLYSFQGRMLLIFSGRSVVASATRRLLAGSRYLSGNITIQQLQEADHRFSRRVWSDQVCKWTVEWLRSSETDGGKSPVDQAML